MPLQPPPHRLPKGTKAKGILHRRGTISAARVVPVTCACGWEHVPAKSGATLALIVTRWLVEPARTALLAALAIDWL